MKLLSILFAFIFISWAHAETSSSSVEAKKTLDGRTVYCAAERDLDRVAYRPLSPTIVPLDGALKLSFFVVSLECSFDLVNGFNWTPRPINEIFSTRSPSGELIQNRVLENEAIVLNSAYSIIGQQILENQATQLVEVPFTLEKLFSKSQIEQLDNGQELNVRLEYFNRAKFEYLYRGRLVKGGRVVGGSFLYSFTLKKDKNSGLISVSAVSVQ